jgi:hypothetical protein
MSSFFDEASLVMIPSGYKDQKVYSVKPLDGSGDLTFSRASDATRVASNGLIEKVRTNLFEQSQALATTWVIFAPSGGGTIVPTNNYAEAPDGTMTATRVQNTGTSAFQWLYQNLTHENNTISVYAKSTSGTNQTFRLFGSNGALNSANFTATNTWQRFTFSVSGITTVQPMGIAADSSGNAYDILFWGAQLEDGDIATDYIPTTTAAVSVGPVSGLPRLDYLNSTCPRLLLEPQRTNIMIFSEQFDNAGWTKTNCTISANNAVSPDGYNNADKIVENTATGLHGVQSGNFTSTTGAVSVFVKAAGRTFFNISEANGAGGFYDLTTGTATGSFATASMQDYGNGWWRCVLQYTFPSAFSTNFRFYAATSMSVNVYAGDGLSGILIYGAQFENASAYATSYIPSLSTSVTRLADAASKTGISSLIGQTEGTVFVEVNYTNTGTDQTFVSISDGTLNNRISLSYNLILNCLNAFVRVGGSTQALMTSATSPADGIKKIALAYKLNDYSLYINGTEVALDSSALVPTCSRIDVGSLLATGVEYPVNQALLFKTRLTPAQLAELTTL